MSRIFISYRREDSAGHAGRLFDRLEQRFGKSNVFMDVSGSIEPGIDFVDAIDRAVGSCDVLIVMIGKDWTACTDAAGQRRLDDPEDFIRLETVSALERDIRVIPVLVQGAAMPLAEDLPDDLRPLARRQAIELSDTRWEFDVEKLVRGLERALSGSAASGRRRIPWLPVAGAALLALAVGWAVWSFGGRTSKPQQASPPEIQGSKAKGSLEAGRPGSRPGSKVEPTEKGTVTDSRGEESRADVSEEDFERVQAIYGMHKVATNCEQVRKVVESLRKHIANRNLVPSEQVSTVRNPSPKAHPTIGDLAKDRILRVQRIRADCFER